MLGSATHCIPDASGNIDPLSSENILGAFNVEVGVSPGSRVKPPAVTGQQGLSFRVVVWNLPPPYRDLVRDPNCDGELSDVIDPKLRVPSPQLIQNTG
jgi:hypothetical protein